MRALDWSAPVLANLGRGRKAFRTVVQILLTSRFAMWMAWGDDLTFFCNDAYLPDRSQARLGAGCALRQGLGGNLARYRASN